MDQTLAYIVDKQGLQEIFYLSGIIDIQAEPVFKTIENKISGSNVIFDYAKVGRINSMGIALILRSLKRLKTERKIKVNIRGTNHINTMLFKMSGIFMLAPEAVQE